MVYTQGSTNTFKGAKSSQNSATGANVYLCNFGLSARLQKVHCMNGLLLFSTSSYKTGVLVITAQLSTENTVQVPLV